MALRGQSFPFKFSEGDLTNGEKKEEAQECKRSREADAGITAPWPTVGASSQWGAVVRIPTGSGSDPAPLALQALPPSGIHIFASQLHTHLTGRKVVTVLARDGREREIVNRDDHYSPHFQVGTTPPHRGLSDLLSPNSHSGTPVPGFLLLS